MENIMRIFAQDWRYVTPSKTMIIPKGYETGDQEIIAAADLAGALEELNDGPAKRSKKSGDNAPKE
jgi:hypothetical protein